MCKDRADAGSRCEVHPLADLVPKTLTFSVAGLCPGPEPVLQRVPEAGLPDRTGVVSVCVKS